MTALQPQATVIWVSMALPNYCSPIANISSSNWAWSYFIFSSLLKKSNGSVCLASNCKLCRWNVCFHQSGSRRLIRSTGCSLYFLHLHNHNICSTFASFVWASQSGCRHFDSLHCRIHKDTGIKAVLLSCHPGPLSRNKVSWCSWYITHHSLSRFRFVWLTISGSDISACGGLWSTLEKQSYFGFTVKVMDDIKCSNDVICECVVITVITPYAKQILFWADKRDKGSHHRLTQMEMGILYVADILLPSRLD